MADFTTALGKNGIAYQRGSFVASMKGEAGMSEEEFNNYYWDSTSNTALHDGKGKDSDGNILDEFGKTYVISYSTATSFGDGVKCKGYADFGVGVGNQSWGSVNFISGRDNLIESGKNNFIGGESCSILGDVGNSFVFGQHLKNDSRWNKTIIGQYNNPEASNILEIGSGTDDANRANSINITYNASSSEFHRPTSAYDINDYITTSVTTTISFKDTKKYYKINTISIMSNDSGIAIQKDLSNQSLP